ncbi:hypothetical protein C8R45DRAFT_940173 [Mycena sanguinolenta]|nr:hypothetical protein C8R45DRAFT_940173 [Mycena sanguinolenta]
MPHGFNTWHFEWLFANVVRLFGLTSNLVRCAFHHAHVLTLLLDNALPLVTLPTLRCLEFSGLRTGSDVLTHLSLFAFETLHIALLQQDPFTDLLPFLQRCAPPLRELVLRGARSTFPFPRLNECLRLLPLLTHLEVWAPFADLDTKLFTALADSESLLPNLRTLRLRSHSLTHHPALHPTVLHMLSIAVRNSFTSALAATQAQRRDS